MPTIATAELETAARAARCERAGANPAMAERDRACAGRRGSAGARLAWPVAHRAIHDPSAQRPRRRKRARPHVVAREGRRVPGRRALRARFSRLRARGRRGDPSRARAVRRRVRRRHQQPSFRRRGLSPAPVARGRHGRPRVRQFAGGDARGGRQASAVRDQSDRRRSFRAATARRSSIDLSLSEVARGKVMVAAKEGKSIPLGWALDRDGNPTTDPQAALEGIDAADGRDQGRDARARRRAAA